MTGNELYKIFAEYTAKASIFTSNQNWHAYTLKCDKLENDNKNIIKIEGGQTNINLS